MQGGTARVEMVGRVRDCPQRQAGECPGKAMPVVFGTDPGKEGFRKTLR